MHTLIMIVAGLLLLAIFVFVARLVGNSSQSAARAALVFVAVWFVCAGVNMYVGVVSAGFTIAQELPFFLAVFGVPAVAAILVRRYCRRTETLRQ